MKVEYIQCDICGNKIVYKDRRYMYTTLVMTLEPEYVNALGDPKANEKKLDICSSCFDKMKTWINEQKGANDGKST